MASEKSSSSSTSHQPETSLPETLMDIGLKLLHQDRNRPDKTTVPHDFLVSPLAVGLSLASVLLHLEDGAAKEVMDSLFPGKTKDVIIKEFQALQQSLLKSDIQMSRAQWLFSTSSESREPKILEAFPAADTYQSLDTPDRADVVQKLKETIKNFFQGCDSPYETELPPSTQSLMVTANYLQKGWNIKLPKSTLQEKKEEGGADGHRNDEPHLTATESAPPTDTFFHGSLGKKPVKMMTGEGMFKFYNLRENFTQFMAMDSISQDLNMIFIRHRNRQGLVHVENYLRSGRVLLGVIQKMKSTFLKVVMPGFSVRECWNMKSALEALGVHQLFQTSQHNDGGKDFRLDDIIHTSFIELDDESGGDPEAKKVKIPPPWIQHRVPLFALDHPFLFLLLHTPTQCPLLLGRLSNIKEVRTLLDAAFHMEEISDAFFYR